MQTAELTKTRAAKPSPATAAAPPAPAPVKPLFSEDDTTASGASAEQRAAAGPPPDAPYVPPIPERPKPQQFLIVDTTATDGKRIHSLKIGEAILDFEFEPRTPKPLPAAIAVKFLAIESFRLSDEDGNFLPWSSVPKQPNQLQAGEQFKIEDDQTIARLDELHNNALKIRALQLPGGERFAASTNRAEMIDAIAAEAAAKRKRNLGKENSVIDGLEEFTPEPVSDSAYFGDEF